MASQSQHIFHVALRQDWEAAKLVGEYRVSTLGRTLGDVGFIHGSFRHQIERIGAFVYATDKEPLVVLDIDTPRLRVPVHIENIEGGSELFPHIYGPLPVEAVIRTLPATTDGGRFVVEWGTAW